jgi:putative ABC transport system permease protein
MKFMTYILRNARRNPVRSFLTVASTGITLCLMTILVSFFAMNDDSTSASRKYNRIFALNAQGFAGRVPLTACTSLAKIEGVEAVSPFSWFGGKYLEEKIPFAQFGVDAETIFKIYEEMKVPPAQLKAFEEDRAGCVIGVKLAADKGLKLGDTMALKGDAYPFDLKLTVRGIYDGPQTIDRRMCMFHWVMLDEGLKKVAPDQGGNVGAIVARCSSADRIPGVCARFDEQNRSSDTPTRTQSEEAFAQMFSEMMGDLTSIMRYIGMAVVFSLIFVAGNAMAMALRERTTEIAVLKAIGFGKQLVLFLVLAEAMVLAGLGGVIGTLGSKAFFDLVDIAPYTGGFLPLFYVPWPTALLGLGASLLIGFLSGIIPAYFSSRLSVINGLRKVV